MDTKQYKCASSAEQGEVARITSKLLRTAASRTLPRYTVPMRLRPDPARSFFGLWDTDAATVSRRLSSGREIMTTKNAAAFWRYWYFRRRIAENFTPLPFEGEA